MMMGTKQKMRDSSEREPWTEVEQGGRQRGERK